MPAVAVLASGAGATQALRRSLPVRSPWTVAACRTVAQLAALFRGRLVDAVIISPSAMALPELAALRGGFPHVPWIAFAPFRPDDGQLLVRLAQGETRLVLVDGVDNAVAGDLVVRHSAAAARQRALRDAVRVLRLTEPLQRQVWEALLARVDQPVRTAEIAKSLGPAQQFIKIVHEELVETLGGSTGKLTMSPKPPTVVLLAGLQGSGKTTAAAKLARLLKSQGLQPLLVGADLQRPAAVEQLRVLAGRVDVPFYSEASDPVSVAREGVRLVEAHFVAYAGHVALAGAHGEALRSSGLTLVNPAQVMSQGGESNIVESRDCVVSVLVADSDTSLSEIADRAQQRAGRGVSGWRPRPRAPYQGADSLRRRPVVPSARSRTLLTQWKSRHARSPWRN